MNDSKEGKFSSLYDLFFDRLLYRIRRKNLTIIQNLHLENIVDIGCGTGTQCQILSQYSNNIVGIDSSDSMLQIARKKNIAHTKFVNQDFLKNDFEDGFFDCAIISFVLHANDEATIKEILHQANRVTDGFLIINDYDLGKGFVGFFASMLIRLIESLAKQEHRRGYFEFMSRGGVKAILLKEGYQPQVQATFYGGTIKTCVIKTK